VKNQFVNVHTKLQLRKLKMPDFNILETHKTNPIFHMDWELTMKCNLDCTYCSSHDNQTKHPTLEECLETVDFLLKYADLYMEHKPESQRFAILNLFGGEAIYHPDFTTILEEIRLRHEPYKHKWGMNIHCITNAVATEKHWFKILSYVDSFTISYHTESTEKQQEQMRNNLLALRDSGKWYQCSVLMHPDYFDNNLSMIEWCKENNITYLPRQLDQDKGNTKFSYKQEQVIWFDNLYKKRSTKPMESDKLETAKQSEEKTDMAKIGRACCGGEALCVDQDFDNKVLFVPGNNFEGWSCSVNWFFVFIKQLERNIYLNKDCRMTFDGTVGPYGSLDDADKILEELSANFKNNTLPVINCKKAKCWCGLCAPKAKSLELYNKMMTRYTV